MRRAVALLVLTGCAPGRDGEAPSWYSPAGEQDVEEPIAFTDEPYGFDGGIAALYEDVLPVDDDGLAYAPGDEFPDEADCSSVTDSDLPMEIEGVVTVNPRFYFKTIGCTNDDEKYYGSFFLEDDDAGIFVLGDTKVAHFEPGDRVRVRVRGVRTSFDLDMLYSWDVVSIDTTDRAIHYQTALAALDGDDISKVRRVVGTVATNADTFGEFRVTDDLGQDFVIQIDSELNRRGVGFDIGSRIEVTGPVLYAYSAYAIIVMSIGQVTVLEPSPS